MCTYVKCHLRLPSITKCIMLTYDRFINIKLCLNTHTLHINCILLVFVILNTFILMYCGKGFERLTDKSI